MQVYIYQAALLCEDCGNDVRTRLIAEGKAPDDPDDESTYDSDEFPKGPYDPDESDSPQHCDSQEGCINAIPCPAHNDHKIGVFLENPLTDEGYESVREALQGTGCVAKAIWAPFYELPIPFNKKAVAKTMKVLLENGECIDPATGEVDYTGLAVAAAEEHDGDSWLDDPDHEIWDLALEVGDYISQLP